jgi:hypothetical protein
MGRIVHRTGKQHRPKTAVKGKRFRCAKCRKRSPRPVKAPAPWYCPRCLGHSRFGTDFAHSISVT